MGPEGGLVVAILVLLFAKEAVGFYFKKNDSHDLPVKRGPKKLPSQVTYHNAPLPTGEKIVSNWKKWQKREPEIDVAYHPVVGTVIENDSGLHWHITNNITDTDDLVAQLVERCSADDLLALSIRNPEFVYFRNKPRLYYAVKELEGRGEWLHLGLLPSLISATNDSKTDGTLSFYGIRVLNRAIYESLTSTANQQLELKDRIFCIRHMRRATAQEQNGLMVAKCPICKQMQDTKELEEVVALIDRRFTWRVKREKGMLYINAIRVSGFFDFDRIEIGDCTLDDINNFCISAGNDPYFSSRRQELDYSVSSGFKLPEHALKSLEKVFE